MSLIWIKICAGLALIAAITGGLAYAHHVIYEQGYTVADTMWKKNEAQAELVAANKLAEANTKVAKAQSQIMAIQADLSNKQKELDNEKTVSATYQSDLSTSRKRLSVLVALSSGGATNQVTSASTATLDRNSEVTAYIDPAVASNLAGLTTTGDEAITRLNACIEAYNSIKTASDNQ